MGQSSNQVLLSYHREAINTRMDEKAFESRHSLSCEGRNLCVVPWYDSAPASPIYSALTVCSLSLRLQSGHRGSGREAVQRHVNEQSVSASCRGSGGGRESFPFRATWLVDVYVGIDQSRQNGDVAEIENVGLSRGSIRFDDILNAFVLDEDRRGPNAIGRDNLSGDEGLQSHGWGATEATGDAKSLYYDRKSDSAAERITERGLYTDCPNRLEQCSRVLAA
jgi:hypothetical protein